MESVVIGTAGHIDHGKTALVKALTGCDTDTLKEEKSRGISINLGFTGFELPNGRWVGMVDVPGHEKFIKNMLAGATGIDVALIVIAANEGIMPQTREHIDILSYLSIQRSLIVLTKVDLVDQDFKDLVVEDIVSSVKGSFLEGTKIVEVDSVSGRGINRLILELELLTADIPKRSFTKNLRMNIDRVFSIKGHGTVVTGTLIEGVIEKEDEVVVYPTGITAKVRNLQVHDRDVGKVYAGQRTAINLSNLAVGDVKRGNTIACKDSIYVTGCIDVRFSIVKNTNFEIGKHCRLKLYIGSSEQVVRFVPITHRKVKAGDEGYAQLVLDHRIAVLKGDRFVLRTITPVTTIGGGMVIDPAPVKYKRISEQLIAEVQLKDSESNAEVMEQYIRNNPFTTFEAARGFVNKTIEPDELAGLIESGLILERQKQYIHIDYLVHCQYQIEQYLNHYHQNHSLRAGAPKAEIFEQLDFPDKKKFELVLQVLIDKQIIKLNQNVVSLFGFVPSLTSGQQQLKDQLGALIAESGYHFLPVKELVGHSREKQQVLEFMLLEDLIMLPGQYVMERELYQKAKKQAELLFAEKESLKLSDFRDRIGASRKYALLILEKFDQEKITRRHGEERILNIK